MKINKLIIENITSLKGHHEIDFDQQLGNEHLFAITGQTGSGKSSILNSLTLALYGKTYKSQLNQKDLITSEEKEGKIELYFTVGQNKYLSIWKCRVRQKNGNLLKKPEIPQRENYIFENDKFILTEKKAEDLLGLDFEQYTKTVVLNQGEFAKFIMSPFHERKLILEKLYSAEKTQNLSNLLFSQLKELNNTIHLINEKLNFIQNSNPDINEDEILFKLNLLNAQINPIKNNLRKINKIESSIKDIISHKTNHDKNSQKLSSFNIMAQELNTDTNLLAQQLKLLSKEVEIAEEDLLKKKPIYLEAINKIKIIEANNTKLKILEKKESDKNNEILNLEKNIKLNNENIEKNQNQINLIRSNMSVQLKDEIDLTSIENKIIDYDKLKDELSRYELNFTNQKEILNNKLSEQKKIENEVQTLISENELILNENRHSFDDYKQEIKKIRNLIELLNNNYKTLRKYQADFEISKNNIIKSQNLIDNVNELIKQRKSQLDSFHKLIEENKIISEKRKFNLFKLDALKSSLDNHHCELCEQNIDPLKIKSIINHINNSIPSIDNSSELELKVKKEESLLQVDTINLNKYLFEFGNYSKRNIEIIEEIKKIFSTQEININSPVSDELIDEYLDHTLTKIEKLNETLVKLEADFIKLNSNYSLLSSFKDQLRIILQTIDNLKGNILNLEKQKSFAQEQINSIISILDSTFPEYKSKIEQFKIDIKLHQNIKIINIENNSLKSKTILFQNNLSSFKTDIIAIQDEIKTLSSLNIELKNQVTEISNGNNLLQLIEQIEQNYFNLKDKLKNMNYAFHKKESEYKELKGKIDHLTEIMKDSSIQFSSLHIDFFKDLHNFLIELKSTPFIFEQISSDTFIKFSTKINPDVKIEDLILFAYEEFLQLINQTIVIFKNEVQKVEANIVASETHLKNIENNKKLIKSLLEQKEEITQKLKLKNKLNSLIGKDEFRNYVLSQIELALIAQTNLELERIYQGRFKLLQQNISNRPEYYILDVYQNSELRKISSLSGGETFLVSLAMALALSELSKGNTSIDSFFIDEGFGTLDKDSLEDVVELLTTLKHRGKVIGIISHIKELTNRIPVNINLVKNEKGHSRINYVQN